MRAFLSIFVIFGLFNTVLLYAEERASAFNPEAKVTLLVVDAAGEPVKGASAGIRMDPGADVASVGLPAYEEVTDKKGKVTATVLTREGRIRYGAVMEGFYASPEQRHVFHERHERRWMPWNPTLKVVLKRKLNPVAMYAKRVTEAIPAENVPVGYDLVAGDWVAPHGKGSRGDLLFTLMRNYEATNDYDIRVTVGFANEGDGVVRVPIPPVEAEGSVLRLPYEAPEAGYENKLELSVVAEPGRVVKRSANGSMNYFLRVRSSVDDNGESHGALYGKVHGDFELGFLKEDGKCAVRFTYYLNPTPGERNVEFDPLRNLFKGLAGSEVVREP